MRYALLLALVFGLWAPAALHAQKASDIEGFWLTENGKSVVRVYLAKNGKYYGKIIWLRDPIDPDTQKPKVDKKNPDPSKRSAPVVGLKILEALEWDDDEWDDGNIYDPESGKTYSVYAEFENPKDLNTLRLRGYIGVSLVGRTTYWKRTAKPKDAID